MVNLSISAKRKAENDKLYKMFCKATKQLCNDLGIDYEQVNKDRQEFAKRSVYNAYGFGCKCPLTFSVILEQINRVDCQMLSVWVQIPYGEGSAPFEFGDYDIPESKRRGDYLVRWVEYAVHKFHLEHKSINLDSRFAGAYIRVYGIDEDPDLTLAEMKIFINGIKKTLNDQIIVYKFRHINQDTEYKSFSYGFSAARREVMRPFWVFFHGVGGTYPAGDGRYLNEIERVTKRIKGGVQEWFDVEYDALHKYLLEHAVSFEPRRSGEIRFNLNDALTEKLEKGFTVEYSKFVQHYENNDYPQALRDLRALVQEMMETICQENNVEIKAKAPSIDNLSEAMISKSIIGNEIRALFKAFAPYPNKASHKLFPLKEDIGGLYTTDLINTTILLGVQLIIHMVEKIKHSEASS